VVVNDQAMYEFVARVARATLGTGGFAVLPAPSMGAEDFAYYLQDVPGCFFRLGLRPPGHSDYPGLHNNHFDFPDAAMESGALMFLSLLSQYQHP
jgi:metal-dependent amidase/aminoacylase/carboxypeptidase family protein